MLELRDHICVLFARHGSKGIPGKNRYLFAGKPAFAWVLDEALKTSATVAVSTDDPVILEFARENSLLAIPRPEGLATDQAHLENVIYDAWEKVLHKYKYVTVLMGNAPFVTSALIAASLNQLQSNPKLDSVVSVSRFPMFAPERARRGVDGLLQPYIDLGGEISCDRSAHTNCYFSNGALTTVRSSVLGEMATNLPPMRWMGKRIGYIEQEPGLGDIDEPWQLAVVQDWFASQEQ